MITISYTTAAIIAVITFVAGAIAGIVGGLLYLAVSSREDERVEKCVRPGRR